MMSASAWGGSRRPACRSPARWVATSMTACSPSTCAVRRASTSRSAVTRSRWARIGRPANSSRATSGVIRASTPKRCARQRGEGGRLMPAKLAKPILDVGMVTDDGKAALAFFRDLLGFAEAGEVPFPGLGVVRRLACGETIFRILDLEKPPASQASTAGFTEQTGLRYLTLQVSNLDELVAEAVQA